MLNKAFTTAALLTGAFPANEADAALVTVDFNELVYNNARLNLYGAVYTSKI